MTVLYQPQYVYLDHAFQKGMGVLCEDGKIKETGTLELLAQNIRRRSERFGTIW